MKPIIVFDNENFCRMILGNIPSGYTQLNGDEYASQMVGKVKPLYDKKTDSIIEGATKKEQEQYEKELFPNGEPKPVMPSKTNAELEEELLTTQQAAMEIFEQNLQLQETISTLQSDLELTQQGMMELFENMLGGAK